MTRGMAFVPAQLESFFRKRLRRLGLIDDVAHPQYMKPLSTVVLSSTHGSGYARNISSAVRQQLVAADLEAPVVMSHGAVHRMLCAKCRKVLN
jgi:hypothetical protein